MAVKEIINTADLEERIQTTKEYLTWTRKYGLKHIQIIFF